MLLRISNAKHLHP